MVKLKGFFLIYTIIQSWIVIYVKKNIIFTLIVVKISFKVIFYEFVKIKIRYNNVQKIKCRQSGKPTIIISILIFKKKRKKVIWYFNIQTKLLNIKLKVLLGGKKANTDYIGLTLSLYQIVTFCKLEIKEERVHLKLHLLTEHRIKLKTCHAMHVISSARPYGRHGSKKGNVIKLKVLNETTLENIYIIIINKETN